MIRPEEELNNLSDDEYAEVVKPADDEIKDYLYNNLLYDFLAKFIATNYKYDVISDSENVLAEYNTVKMILSNMPEYSDIDIEKLKNELEKKHSLKLTSADPIRIEEIK